MHRHLFPALNLLDRPIDKVAHNLVCGACTVVKVHFDVFHANVGEMAFIVSVHVSYSVSSG
jgi:hypothetical protein